MAIEGVAQEVQRSGLVMLRAPVGFSFAPAKNGEVLPAAAFEVEAGEIERARADLLVLSRTSVSAALLASVRRPLLLVGRRH